MKQIIPFKKDLLFKTKVSEITSISLEHQIMMKQDDAIHGYFFIKGDYKMTASSINRESFEFKIPFDIELDGKYVLDTLVVDIDNFYYEVMNNESLQVNIDLYISGEKKEEEVIVKDEDKDKTELEDRLNLSLPFLENPLIEKQDEEVTSSGVEGDQSSEEVVKKEELFHEKREEKEEEIDSAFSPSVEVGRDFQIFDQNDSADTYVTYHVYIVKEQDTLEMVMKKYGVDKEMIEMYNAIDEFKPGMKLIIPNSHE